MALTQRDRAAIARGQRRILAVTAAVPYRPDGMNDMPRRQAIAFGDFGVAGVAAVQRVAFGEQLRPGRAVDGAIDAAAAQQRAIRGVDDRVNA
jgi:hypothetical protein